MNQRISITIAFGALLAASAVAGPKHPKLATDFENAKADQTVDVIIQYAEPVSDSHVRALKAHGARHKQTFHSINAALASVPAAELERLAGDPSVVFITPDRVIEGTLDRAASVINYYPLDNYLQSINQSKGAGIGIVLIDSGIAAQVNFDGYLTPSLNRIVDAESMIDTDPVDRYGHGTHVAGIATGMDNVTSAIAGPVRAFWGIAPDAMIISLKVLNASGAGSDSAVIAGIERAIALKSLHPEWNIKVINLSLGRPVFESYKLDPLCKEVEKAWKAGIFVVVAAGNDGRNNTAGNHGYGTIMAPGNDPLVMTVGAVNDRASWDRNSVVMTSYSSKGPTLIDHIAKPDIVAPGNRVVSYAAPGSALSSSYPANLLTTSAYDPKGSTTALSPYYLTLSGTSMAAPQVAGLAAVLYEFHPALTPDQMKALMMRNAWRGLPAAFIAIDPVTNAAFAEVADIFTVGAGMLDCWQTWQDAAAQNLSTIPGGVGAAASPSVYYDSTAKNVKLNLNSTGATSVAWGSSVSWGTSVIWGTTSPWAMTSTPSGEASAVSINGEN